MGMNNSSCILEAYGISKNFGGIKALDAVDFTVKKSEIVGLIGDNGAGKSTLIKILAGVIKADKGVMYFKGRKIDLDSYSVQQARELGIEVVFQERALVEQHTFWRNLFIGRELTTRFGFLDIPKMKEISEKLKAEIGFMSSGVNADSIVKKLSGGEKQGIAIGRALYFQADLILMDEPFTGLSVLESRKVQSFIKELKQQGKSCVVVSHNPFQIYEVADRFVFLNRGRKIGELTKEHIPTVTDLEDIMVHVARTDSLPFAVEKS